MISLTINGKAVKAEKGEMLLAVIRRAGFDVPALCHHEAVEPFGACRLCMVEITKKEWDGWSNQVTSCLYPAEDGLIVTTHSQPLVDLRKTIIDLYLARSPKSEKIRDLALEYGIEQTSFVTVSDGDNCILCGLCTRICDAMGFFAISAVGRGHGKKIAPPLDQPPPDCTGCLSCANICPTDFIEYTDTDGSRTIWGKTFEMIACKECGARTITREFAETLSRLKDIPLEYFDKCDKCRRSELSLSMGRIASWSKEEPAQ